jgi:hypothetical protein
VYCQFVDSVTADCRAIALHHLEVAVSEWMTYSEDHTHQSAQMQLSQPCVPETQLSPIFPGCESPATRVMMDSQETVLAVDSPQQDDAKPDDAKPEWQTAAAYVYRQIRDGVVKSTIPTTFHSSLVGSFRERLASAMLVQLFGQTDQDMVKSFSMIDINSAKAERHALSTKIGELDSCEQDFKLLVQAHAA